MAKLAHKAAVATGASKATGAPLAALIELADVQLDVDDPRTVRSLAARHGRAAAPSDLRQGSVNRSRGFERENVP